MLTMKLHHFIAAKVSEEGNRAREVGRALAPTAVPQTSPVSEVKLADIKKIEDKPVTRKPAVKDQTEEMRDYAVSQLEGSTCHMAHHKIKHYD